MKKQNLNKLNSKIKYDDRMDKKVLPLCNALNSLPSIKTFESCCGHSCSGFNIWFEVGESKEGLFFLTRCVDNRYWEYGYLWKIELVVGDRWDGKNLPIHYRLHSGNIVGKLAYQQAKSLLVNMNHHLNHKGFMNGFNLNINNFNVD